MFNFKRFWKGINIVPKATPTADSQGDIEVSSSTGKISYHNGTNSSPIVTESHAGTLINKTIDADDNLITDLETDNLKAGVLNLDLSVPTPTDTEIPSALAVKTYVDTSSGSVQADVDDLVTLTGVPVNSTDLGTFTETIIADGSTIKQALQDLETFAADDALDLFDHITDATDAHDASAISNVPSGNLSATDQQSANNELQTDIDTRATQVALDAHINDTTDAHDASAISNIPSGNLSSTDQQGVNNELQADVDTRIAGPASATDSSVVVYNGTTGKLVKDSVINVAGNNVSVPGVLTAAGITATAQYRDGISTNNQSGTNITLSTIVNPILVLNNSGLVSIGAIDNAVSGFNLTLINRTGNSVTILNEELSKTAGLRILTGTSSSLSLANKASILLKYDSVNSRFSVIGGSGSGGGSSLDTVFQLTGLDVTTWSTGNNATFLGGGSMAGTFAADTSTPLQGTASYLYTQAPVPAVSVNDYACSPAQPVDIRFRGQNVTLYMPMLYNGLSTDIQWIFYDATNAAIIPSSVFIPLKTGTSTIFKTNIVIPLTCASIRVGFQVKTTTLSAVFEFDSVQLTADTTVMASIANQTQTTTFSAASATITLQSGTTVGSGLYSVSGAVLTALKDISINASVSASGSNTAANGGVLVSITAPGSLVVSDRSTTASGGVIPLAAGVTAPLNLLAGQSITLAVSLALFTIANTTVFISATASNPNILTAPDTFSTDTAPLVYAGSATYTLATLANAPVGTFITYTYAASGNTTTQTTAAPTQTIADMNTNGILLYPRAYSALSTAALPTMVAIQIGKGMKGVELQGYAAAGRVTSISLDAMTIITTIQAGLLQAYNSNTGILLIDAGQSPSSAFTTHSFYSASSATTGGLGSYSSGYITINASKNPALTGLNINAVAARGVSTSGQSIPNTGSTTMTYDAVKTYDTNSALESATGIFTAPESGYYQVSAGVIFTTQSYAIANAANIKLIKNGVATPVVYGTIFVADRATTYEVDSLLSTGINLTKGDTLSIQCVNNRTGGATTLGVTSGYNYFSVHKTNVG